MHFSRATGLSGSLSFSFSLSISRCLFPFPPSVLIERVCMVGTERKKEIDNDTRPYCVEKADLSRTQSVTHTHTRTFRCLFHINSVPPFSFLNTPHISYLHVHATCFHNNTHKYSKWPWWYKRRFTVTLTFSSKSVVLNSTFKCVPWFIIHIKKQWVLIYLITKSFIVHLSLHLISFCKFLNGKTDLNHTQCRTQLFECWKNM